MASKEDRFTHFDKFVNIHCPVGLEYQNLERVKAFNYIDNNELEAIYHLTESHAPGLRLRAVNQYEKDSFRSLNSLTINKNNVEFNCGSRRANIDVIMQQIKDMPKEWTVIQITPEFNLEDSLNCDSERFTTTALYVCVFNCGQNKRSPFCVRISEPRDKISGCVIEIRKEINKIIKDNKEGLTNIKLKSGRVLKNMAEKEAYWDFRISLNNRMKDLIKQVQESWLKAWRCLLIGKFQNEQIETDISNTIDEILKENNISYITEKSKDLLIYLVKGYQYLQLNEIKSALEYCIPNIKTPTDKINILKAIKHLSNKLMVEKLKRHPVILIVDEKYDSIPWEMLNVLQDHPVSRMPSLHFTYALFKEHENSIKNGIITGIDSKKGSFIINPELDLQKMQIRLSNFFNYWKPDWQGLVGETPSGDRFKELLTKANIFSYSGHGNGSQFLSGDKIQKLRIETVVLLFGCGSVRLTSLGPQAEMIGSHYMYLIACSPCVVGMLWEVTDTDTDLLTTEFLSQWIPSEAEAHWKLIDKKKWEKGERIVLLSNRERHALLENDKHEPELLRAICKSRKAASQFLTQAACVARGLPVKID